MTEEMKPDQVQENQETQVENKQESPSDPSLLQEVMAKKAKIKEQDEIIAQYKAEKEKGRQKTMEEQGQLKELNAELKTSLETLNAKLESQSVIVNNYKQNLVNGLTSEDERKEYLSTKSVDFLEELTKEKNLMQPQTVSNPGETLGAVRKTVSNKPFSDMTETEKREWHKQMTTN